MKCEIGGYSRSYGLGSWQASIYGVRSENCVMEIITEAELGFSKYFCNLSLNEFEKNDWNTAEIPYLPISKELLSDDCNEICKGNIIKSTCLSPLKQLRLNVSPLKISCREKFVLIFKSKDNFPACVTQITGKKLIERGWARSSDVSSSDSRTGNLTVYLLPYPTNEEYLGDAQKMSEAIKFLGEANFIPFGEFGASKLGQYDNDGKIRKPSESVKFSIQNDVKKPNDDAVTVNEISEDMLFGNGITYGAVDLKDGTTTNATIIVVDSSFESVMNPIMDRLASLLMDQTTWMEIDPIQCGGNPWEQDWIESHPDDYFVYARVISKEKIDIITNYYKKLGITIFDVKLVPWEDAIVCESCSCPAGYTQSLLVSDSDVDRMLEFGYKISNNSG